MNKIFESFIKDIFKINQLVSELEDLYGRHIRVVSVFPEYEGYKVIYETGKPKESKNG